MSTWFDVIALVLTLTVVGGVVYAVIQVSQAVSQHVETTKKNLKDKGYNISDKGISIKTNKRFDREDYVDATQRGFVKAVGAASFGKSQFSPSGASPGHSPSAYSNHSTSASSSPTASTLSPPPSMKRTASAATTSSVGSTSGKKSRNPFKRTSSQAS